MTDKNYFYNDKRTIKLHVAFIIKTLFLTACKGMRND